MKYLKLLSLGFCCFLFSGCFDTVEELQINANGSGTMQVKMDMGQMLEMMKGMIAEEELSKSGMGKAIDTTILMKSLLDTAANVTPDKKALFRDGVMHMNIDMSKNLMKMDLSYPFKDLNSLNKIYEYVQKGEGGMMDALKTMPGNALDAPSDDDKDGGSPAQLNNVYDISITDGKYEKKLNKERLQQLMNDPKMEEMKGMLGMMGDMNYTIILKLPRPAKTVSNSNAIISADKKTVTYKTNMFDVFEKPETMELKVEY